MFVLWIESPRPRRAEARRVNGYYCCSVVQAVICPTNDANGVLVRPLKAMSSMSQPGLPVDSSAPIRKRSLICWLANVVPRLMVTLLNPGHPALRLMNALRFVPMGALVTPLVWPLYGSVPTVRTSTQLAPLSVLISTTPPSHAPCGGGGIAVLTVNSNACRCRNDIVSGPDPTSKTGGTIICSAGRESFLPSTCPLLSGPKNTCWIGDSARRCHDVMFGSATVSPVIVQP